MPSVSRFIREIERVAGMHGNWDVFLYACPGDLAEASIEFDVLRLVNMSSGVAVLHEWQFVEMVAWKLHEHLARTRGNYETVGLVADDAAYPPLFSNGSVLDFLVCCYRSRWLMGDESGIMMPITS